MHYSDDYIIDKAVLKLVIYKHSTWIDNCFSYDVTQILECKHVKQTDLINVLMDFRSTYMEELHMLDPETFTVFEFGYNSVAIDDESQITEIAFTLQRHYSVTDKMHKSKPYLTLH